MMGDRLICLVDGEETRTAAACLDGPWPDASARTLAAALVRLPQERLDGAVERILAANPRWPAPRPRVFTRTEVAARRIHGKFHHLGEELDAVVLVPSPAERRALESWLSERPDTAS